MQISSSIRNAFTRNNPLKFGFTRNGNPLNFSTIRKKKIYALSFYRPQNVFEEALDAVKFLDWHKIFGLAQNILDLYKDKA